MFQHDKSVVRQCLWAADVASAAVAATPALNFVAKNVLMPKNRLGKASSSSTAATVVVLFLKGKGARLWKNTVSSEKDCWTPTHSISLLNAIAGLGRSGKDPTRIKVLEILWITWWIRWWMVTPLFRRSGRAWLLLLLCQTVLAAISLFSLSSLTDDSRRFWHRGCKDSS